MLSTLLCEHLKQNIDPCRVHYLVHEHTAAVVKGNPFIDELILFKPEYRSNKLKFFKFLADLRKTEFDSVIDVYGKLESQLISLFAKSPLKISYKKWYSSFIYHKTFKRGDHPVSQMGHAIETRLHLLQPLLPELKDRNRLPKIYRTLEEISRAKSLLKQHKIPVDRPIVMVGALGSAPNKTYPLPYLAKLLDRIIERQAVTFLVNALPNQKTAIEKLINYCAPETQELFRTELYLEDLRDFITLLGECDAYIGNEGGASNMARALQIPNFAIFSPWISKEAWLTDKSNSANQAVHISDYVDGYQTLSKKERKEQAEILYKEFTPALIEPKLLEFLERKVLSGQ